MPLSAEKIPVEPDQGNACAGKASNHFPSRLLHTLFIKIYKMKRIFFLSFSIIIFFNAVAQRDSIVNSRDTVELVPVEVRAVRGGTRAPFAKTTLSKADIDKQNVGQDIPFILNQTPSVIINSDAGNGVGYTGIRIRGSDATRVNVTLNGMPFNDGESGGTFFVDLPDFVSSVNSIQVQRGVGSSSNGSGAFGASIHLSTNDVIKIPYLELANNIGSFQTYRNTLKMGSGLLGQHFTVDARLSNIRSNGYIERAKSHLQSYYFSTAYIADKTTLRLNAFTGKEKTYQAWNGVSESDLKGNRRINYAGTERKGEPYDDETDNYTQNNYQAFFTQKLSPKLVFNTGLFYVKGKGYYNQYKATARYAAYSWVKPVKGSDTIFTSDLVRQLWLNNDFYGDVFSLQYSSNGTQLIGGGSLSKYKGQHFGEVVWAQNGLSGPTRYYDVTAHKHDFNVYTKWTQDLSNSLQSYVDIQYRGVRYKINGFKQNPTLQIEQQYNFFNPKAGLIYHQDMWFAFASFSVANKEPNRDDFEASSHEIPKREKLNDLEIGLENKSKNANGGLNFYYMKYNNQLVLTGKINDVGAYTRTNVKDSYRAGLELQASAIILPWLTASGNVAFSQNRIKNFSEFIDDYDAGNQKMKTYNSGNLAFSPSVVSGATVTFIPIKKLDLSLISKYVSSQYLDNTSNKDRMLNAYFTEDVRASYSFNIKSVKNITITAQVNNLFNALYEPNGYTFSYYSNNRLNTENYYFPMAGINWNFGLQMRF